MVKYPDAIQPIRAALCRDSCTHLPRPRRSADWLSRAFGFTIRLRIANHRIQMKAGDGCFTIAEGNVIPNNAHIVQVRIEDVKGTASERDRAVPSS